MVVHMPGDGHARRKAAPPSWRDSLRGTQAWALACTSAASCRRILGGKRWLGGKCCQGRQPPKAGAAGPPLQGLPLSHTRPPRSTAGNINSAGCLKTGPQYKDALPVFQASGHYLQLVYCRARSNGELSFERIPRSQDRRAAVTRVAAFPLGEEDESRAAGAASSGDIRDPRRPTAHRTKIKGAPLPPRYR